MARILITNFHPVGGGGHVPYVQALTRLNAESPHTIGVAVPQASRLYTYLAEQGYPHLYACDFPAKIQRELPAIVRNVRRFKAIVADFKPDLVHANGSPDLSIAAWSDPFARHFRLVRTHHAIKKIPHSAYHRWLYQRRVGGNIFVSRSAMEMSCAQGLTPARCEVIENGVDLDHYQPRERDRELAAGLGLADDMLCFGSCAGLGSYKRVDSIIEAARQLQDERPFRIVALGDAGSGAKLQQLAAARGVSQFVYGGFQQDVRPLVALFDVGFILSDAIETISFAAREMMAMGKPLLSSSFSGLKENLIDGENGLLVPPGDIDRIAAAMRRYLRMDAGELAAFAAAARRHAEENFAISRQLARHRAVYETVLAAPTS